MLQFPHTAGFILSFNSLRIPDGKGGNDIGIREISLKNTMKGRSKVFGLGRTWLGYTSGTPDWEASIKWELTHFGRWAQANQPYQDTVFSLPFLYLEKGVKYEVRLSGVLYKDEDHSASEGSEGALEKTLNFFVGEVQQFVDGVEIAYRIPEGEVG